MIESATPEPSLFAVTSRLQTYLLSGDLEEQDQFRVVVVRTEAGFAPFAHAWRRVIAPYDDSGDGLLDDDEGFEIWGPVPTPRGPAFTLSKFLTPMVCLQRFVDLLTRTGLGGELDHFHDEESPRSRDDQILCRIDLDADAYLCLHGHDPYPLPPADLYDQVRGLPRWALPDSRLGELVDFVVAWCCLDRTARIYLDADLISFRVAPDDVVGLFRDAVRWRGDYAPVEIIAETATHSRWVRFDPGDGVVTFAISGWPMTDALRAQALADLRRVLVATADWSIYGRIRRAGPYPWPTNDLAYGYSPEPRSNPIPDSLALRLITERGAVPDAFGIQLISPSLAATGIPHNARWVSARLDTGHVLLEHHDLDAWYANAQPNATVLDQARTDLAALIRPTRSAHHNSA